MTSVALLSSTGYVGKGLLKAFLPAHAAGKIKLTVLHRPSSDVTGIPSEVERRILDLNASSEEEIELAVKGIEVFISAVGSTSQLLQTKLLPALAASKTLKAFIPSDYGSEWSDEERKIPELKFVNAKYQVVEQARGLQIPTTEVRTGLFTDFFFAYKALGTDAKSNIVAKYGKSLSSPIPLTDIAHVGQTLLDKINNLPPKLTIYTLAPTGQDLVAVLTSIHNHPTEITEYTEAENKQSLGSGPGGAIKATLWSNWANNTWNKEHNAQGLEALVRRYI